MQVNKPDKGVFKGLGPLERELHINRKYFPKLRNLHNFQYTHSHPNNYQSSFKHFYKNHQNNQYQKSHKNCNDSTIVFGLDKNRVVSSLQRDDFKKHQFHKPPSMIKHQEEGIGIGRESLSKNQLNLHYKTTTMEQFNSFTMNEKQNIQYKDTRLQRFNPITGESKTLNSFGFEDFSMNKDKKYKANNFTSIPQGRDKFDIISGRKITYN